MAPRPRFPASAASWLVTGAPRSILAIASASLPAARRIRGHGCSLTLIESDLDRAATASRRHPGLRSVVGAAEELPFASTTFDVVLAAEVLSGLAPRLALAEFARVLHPGGTLAVVQTARDNSVPWVRRLASLLRRFDPQAMSTDPVAESQAALDASHYFTGLERREFRLWVPMARADLLAMVSRSPGIAGASAQARQTLLLEIADLYDSSAKAPDPLLLPYAVACWRGTVDHAELTRGIQLADEGLRITL